MSREDFVNHWYAQKWKTAKSGSGAKYVNIEIQGVRYNVSVVEDDEKEGFWKWQIASGSRPLLRSRPECASENEAKKKALESLADTLKL